MDMTETIILFMKLHFHFVPKIVKTPFNIKYQSSILFYLKEQDIIPPNKLK